MLEKLKQEVLKANLDLVKHDLVLFTWGNASGIHRDSGLVVIKPSGVDYDNMTVEDMVVVDLGGNVVEGKYKPSSDTSTHLELYKACKDIGGVVHTHSTYATSFAQAGMGAQPLGTTHADYFYGEVPCTRKMTKKEIESDYEKETGKVIVETFSNNNFMEIPAVFVNEHGPFSWGKDVNDAVYHSVVLEQVCKMNMNTILLKNCNTVDNMSSDLIDKHYLRKHGKNSYYGQLKK